MTSMRWTHRSTRQIGKSIKLSHTTTWRLLRKEKYGLRSNRKRLSLKTSPHRDRQFKFIERLIARHVRRGLPVQSIDAKHRELIGNFKNPGRNWVREARNVNMYDFPGDADGIIIPYGVYDVGRQDGFVVVGTSANTPDFAAHSVLTWWRAIGHKHYPAADEILLLADSGSSNATRTLLWKYALQTVANTIGLPIRVAHYPAGGSKWNPVEHRLFSAITRNWQGEPLLSIEVAKNFISRTRTPSKRRVRVRVNHDHWPTQKELALSKQELPPPPRLNIRRSRVLPDLNYVVFPDPLRRR